MKVLQVYYLCRRVSLQFHLWVGLSLLFLFSCTSGKENPVLLRADSLMTEFPDSALNLLESMSSIQQLSRADKALYALLLTQARHKNYIPLTNDSLIRIAVGYYGNKKKSLRTAQAHYYWGATYQDMGRISFAVEEYLLAIRLMPTENEFLAIIYNNLATCYANDGLYDEAMDAYRKEYRLSKDNDEQIYYPLRGMAHTFLAKNQLDSALYYFQRAFDVAVVKQNIRRKAILYHDFAMTYKNKKDYIRANENISKAIPVTDSENLGNVFLLKGQLLQILNQPDSARYYFDKSKDKLDVYGQAMLYDELRKMELKVGNWEAAARHSDTYLILHDSIAGLSQSRSLSKLINSHQFEKHKDELSRQGKRVMWSLLVLFFILVSLCCFVFLWNDRKRKKRYIAMQQELIQKRVDIMLLKEKDASDSVDKTADQDKLAELHEQQLQLCLSMFKTTACYKKLQSIEKASVKEQVRLIGESRLELNKTISKTFIDVMSNLKECCMSLTNDDLFYCVLSLIPCSKILIMGLMNVSPDAFKMRKSRIKAKMTSKLFNAIFVSDNQ